MVGQVIMALTPWASRARQSGQADDRAAVVLAAVDEAHQQAQEAVRDATLALEISAVEAALGRRHGAP